MHEEKKKVNQQVRLIALFLGKVWKQEILTLSRFSWCKVGDKNWFKICSKYLHFNPIVF